MAKIFLYPGQGSQKKGMGEGLFERYPELVAQADRQLGYSLKTLCLEDPEGKLDQTQYTQPALFAVSALMHLARVAEGEQPDLVAGHSLGEYAALFAAGVIDFATGVRLVQKRGEIMARAQGGGMAAIVGLPAETVRKVLDDKGLTSIDVANFNAPTQVVISGPKADIEAAQPFFKDAGVRLYIILKVSGAFHSRYMSDAANEFGKFLADARFSAPKLPVIANLDAEPYTLATVREKLTGQINHSVLWVKTIQRLAEQPTPSFQEVGPGNVLTGLLRQILR